MVLKCKPAFKKWKQIWQLGPVSPHGCHRRRPRTADPQRPTCAHTATLPDVPHPRHLSPPRTSLFDFSPCLWGHLSLWLLIKVTLTCPTNGKYEAPGGVAWQSGAYMDLTPSQSRAAQEPDSVLHNQARLCLPFSCRVLGEEIGHAGILVPESPSPS